MGEQILFLNTPYENHQNNPYVCVSGHSSFDMLFLIFEPLGIEGKTIVWIPRGGCVEGIPCS